MSRRRTISSLVETKEKEFTVVPRGLKDVVAVSRKAEAHDILVELLKRLAAAEGDYDKSKLLPMSVRAGHEMAYKRAARDIYEEIVQWLISRR